jgi:hypothetical protein
MTGKLNQSEFCLSPLTPHSHFPAPLRVNVSPTILSQVDNHYRINILPFYDCSYSVYWSTFLTKKSK